MAKILVPIADKGFDPTETGVPWKILRAAGHDLIFATPDGKPGQADPIMVTGKGLGLLAPILMADSNGVQAYREMERSAEFQKPIRYDEIRTAEFDAVLLPGGHAPETKVYLESTILQEKVAEFFAQDKVVGAICHGVVLAARSCTGGKSVLFGKKTTALTEPLELIAWFLTRLWKGRYYRTYKETVEKEVGEALATPADFIRGPFAWTRDSPENLDAGFVVLDGKYLSARWPGDAHRFGTEFSKLLPAALTDGGEDMAGSSDVKNSGVNPNPAAPSAPTAVSPLVLPPPVTGGLAWLREITTTAIAVAVVGTTLTLMYLTFSSKENFTEHKDIMLYGFSILGTVIGYYFGRVPAERRAETAEQKATETQNVANQHAVAAGQAWQQADQSNQEKEAAVQKLAEATAGIERAKAALEPHAQKDLLPEDPEASAAPGDPAGRIAAFLELEVLLRLLSHRSPLVKFSLTRDAGSPLAE